MIDSRVTRTQLLVLAGWLTLGLLESAKAWLNWRLMGQPTTWSASLVGNMPWWLAWAALTPVVGAAGRRWRTSTTTATSAGTRAS